MAVQRLAARKKRLFHGKSAFWNQKKALRDKKKALRRKKKALFWRFEPCRAEKTAFATAPQAFFLHHKAFLCRQEAS